jgi:hypothetical protein
MEKVTEQERIEVSHPMLSVPLWPWVRIIVAYGLLEWALWMPDRHLQEIASLVFITWVLLTTLAQGKSLRALGLGITGLRGAAIAIPIALIAAGLILLASWRFGTLRPLYGSRPLPHALGYSLWAMIQEFILNSFFFLTLEELLPRARDAAIVAVMLFTLAHIPNPVLMVGTLLLSTLFVTLFRRYRNIYPLGIAHAILGLTLAIALPDSVLRHMRVGIGFYHFVIK